MNKVAVAYGTPEDPQAVLTGITAVVREGEWLAVVGRNGSGKSTFARLLAGLSPLSSGRCSIELPSGARVRIVLQNPETQLIGQTVEEDLLFGLEAAAASLERIPELLEQALQDMELVSLRDKPVEELSGGQKQRLAAAGALAAGARLLIFDEAASMLDPAAREHLLLTAQGLKEQGIGIVWITQSMEELAPADRVIALDAGRIAYTGSVRRFFYGSARSDRPSICERLGLSAPYAVEVGRELIRNGVLLPFLPLTVEQLAEAVGER